MIFVHLGMPKAASSFIQVNLFKGFNRYLGSVPTENLGGNGNISEHDNLLFDELIEAVCKFDDHNFDLWRKSYSVSLDKNLVYVLSSEYFMSPHYSVFSFEKKIYRLEKTLEDYELTYVIVIRNLLDVAKSLYADYPYHPSRNEGETIIYSFEQWLKIDLNLEESYMRYLVNFSDFISSRKHLCFEFEKIITVSGEFRDWLQQLSNGLEHEFEKSEPINTRIGFRYHLMMSFAHKLKPYFPLIIRRRAVPKIRTIARSISRRVKYNSNAELSDILLKNEIENMNLMIKTKLS